MCLCNCIIFMLSCFEMDLTPLKNLAFSICLTSHSYFRPYCPYLSELLLLSLPHVVVCQTSYFEFQHLLCIKIMETHNHVFTFFPVKVFNIILVFWNLLIIYLQYGNDSHTSVERTLSQDRKSQWLSFRIHFCFVSLEVLSWNPQKIRQNVILHVINTVRDIR